MKRLCVPLLVVALAMAGQAATSSTSSSGTSRYVVHPGDTLTSIAASHGTTVAAILRLNSVRNPNHILIGMTLTLPARSSGSAAVTPPSTSTHGLPARLQAHPERLAYRPLFVKWANYYGVPADLVEAMAWMESGWQPNVVSPTGAIGIGQLQPETVALVRRWLGNPKLDPRSPDDNIRMSTRFLRYLLDATGGNVRVALAAYYQGLRSVSNGTTFTETVHYVDVVVALRPAFR